MTKAAIYTRVSSDEQATSGHSLTSQEELCRQYAKANKLEVVRVYSDTLSGSTLDRPRLEAMLLAADGGEIGAVICHANDRLTRDRMHLGHILERLMRADCELHFVNQGRFDFESPEARMMLGMLGEFASYWREKIRMNARMGKRRRAVRGLVALNDVAPYGYRFIGQDTVKADGSEVRRLTGALEIVPEEADVVRRIFAEYVSGDSPSLEKTAKMLLGTPNPTDAGHGPSGFAKGHRVAFGVWNPSMIKRMLQNTTYSGTWVYGQTRTRLDGERVKNGDTVNVEVPAVVTKETQEKALKRLAGNRTSRGSARRRQYLLSGHLRCGTCGLTYSGMVTIHADVQYPYYRCSGHQAKRTLDGKTLRCNSPTLRAEWVEEQTRMFLVAVANYPEFGKALAERDRAAAKATPAAERLEKVNARLAVIAAKRARRLAVLDDVGGGSSAKAIGRQLAELDTEEARLTKEKRDLENAPSSVEFDERMIAEVYADIYEGMVSTAFGKEAAQTYPMPKMGGKPFRPPSQYEIWIMEGKMGETPAEVSAKAIDGLRAFMREVEFKAVVKDDSTVDLSARIPAVEGLIEVQSNVLAFWTLKRPG